MNSNLNTQSIVRDKCVIMLILDVYSVFIVSEDKTTTLALICLVYGRSEISNSFLISIFLKSRERQKHHTLVQFKFPHGMILNM